MKTLLKKLRTYALYIAFLQSWLAMLGSLYFSEVKGLPPCQFCWYQRIFMYPMALLFAVAIIRRDNNIAYYALPLSLIGAVIAMYHYLIQWTALKDVNPISCSLVNECSQKQVVYFSFITIPLFSFAAFLIISILMLLLIKSKKNVNRK